MVNKSPTKVAHAPEDLLLGGALAASVGTICEWKVQHLLAGPAHDVVNLCSTSVANLCSKSVANLCSKSVANLCSTSVVNLCSKSVAKLSWNDIDLDQKMHFNFFKNLLVST